ncbi:MAG: alpha/beta hydrolase-fold protein [Planctomycetota bacterium]
MLALALLLATFLPSPQIPTDPDETIRRQIVEDGLGLAMWCQQKGLVKEARTLLDSHLVTFDPVRSMELAQFIRSLPEAPPKNSKGPTKDFERKTRELSSRHVGLWIAAAQSPAVSADFLKRARFLLSAQQINPWNEKLMERVPELWAPMIDSGSIITASRMIRPYLRHKSLGDKAHKAYAPIEAQVADFQLIFDSVVKDAKAAPAFKVRGHDLMYYVLLPDGWNPGTSWPVIVSINGAGGEYKGELSSWMAQRARGYVVIVPITFSNTNQGKVNEPYPYKAELVEQLSHNKVAALKWEEEGIRKALPEWMEQFQVDPSRVFLTGFSGGGLFSYYAIFNMNDIFRAVAPRNANFHPLGVIDPKRSGDYPIHIFTSDQDEYAKEAFGAPGLDPQTELAKQVLKDKGFTHVIHTALADGGPHGATPGYYSKILHWFDQQWKNPPSAK